MRDNISEFSKFATEIDCFKQVVKFCGNTNSFYNGEFVNEIIEKRFNFRK